MRVHLRSTGCRLNRSEIEALARRLLASGHVVVSDPALADVCLLNTCAVTVAAERKSRRQARALARANPESPIAILGCYATLAPDVCTHLPNVAWVVPNDEKDMVVDLLGDHVESLALRREEPGHGLCSGTRAASEAANGQFAAYPTRPFVKVQDGCDNHCTYCIVRLLRGASRSRPVASVIDQVQALVGAGHREVVLTGVNLGSYGRDLGLEGGLRDLINALLSDTQLARLRLSSVEPWDIVQAESFFALWEDARLCRHLHLPLQSGCDATLRRMGRPITTREFARLVTAARAAIPDLAVTTDVITGFPGEDETAFRASREFVGAIELAGIHVFSYSPRPGTAAARMPNRLPRAVCDARASVMREVGAELAARFRQSYLGREMRVLWERRGRDGLWRGLTTNYLRVVTDANEELHNRITVARLSVARSGHLAGEVVV
jgi:threonylcarbamoyladenosine tRNA methylthiotransferase MtaB